ncbi:MAG: cell division protein FtsQ/DivIB [Sphingomonadales bacterium]
MTKAKARKAPSKNRKSRAKKAAPKSQLNHVRLAGYVFVGAALASAAALAVLFVDFKTLPRDIATGTQALVKEAGFNAQTLQVYGAQRFTFRQVEQLAAIDTSATIFGQDLEAIQARLVAHPWVKEARVSRNLPGTLRIDLEERTAFARWQVAGKFHLIDDEGTPFLKIGRKEWRSLPLVVGDGANQSAGTLSAALTNYPYLADRLSSATWVGARRWDLLFQGGVLVRLPEEQTAEKLGQLSAMHARDNILDAGPMRIDMRMDHMLAISTDPTQFRPKPRPKRPKAQTIATAS